MVKATGKMLLLPGTEEEGDHDHGKEGHHHEQILMYGCHQNVLLKWWKTFALKLKQELS